MEIGMSADYRANNDAMDDALSMCKCGHRREEHHYNDHRDAEQCDGCRKAHYLARRARKSIEHKFVYAD
jgi:hypothetical protein